MAEIKIFLAPSNKLKADRNQFEIFIRRKNDRWQKEGKSFDTLLRKLENELNLYYK